MMKRNMNDISIKFSVECKFFFFIDIDIIKVID